MIKTPFLLFIGAMLLFIVVLPGNHSEAEDAFEYARQIEEDQGAQVFHPHHLLYIPLQKAVYRAAQVLGYDGRSYYVARMVSMFSGALGLCFFYLVACRMQALRKVSSTRSLPLLSTMGLLFSYGFMRYACEVEIYLPAFAVGIVSFYAALRAQERSLWLMVGIIFSALAVLMHTLNAALALVIIPIYYFWVADRRKFAIIHAVATVASVGLIYGFIQNTWGTFRPSVDTTAEGWLQPGTVGKGIVGFGQCLLSANFAFAYEPLAEKLQSVFPYRIFSEEIFAGSHLPHGLRLIAPLTFVLSLAGMMAAGISLLINACRWRAFDRVHVVIVLWLGGTMFPTLLLEPSNPELWILVLIPFWILFLWVACAGHLSAKTVQLLWVMVALLGVHNIVAGMGAVRDRSGDYNYSKAEWILDRAGTNDVIHTAESYVFTFYLNYWTDAEVRNVNAQNWESGKTTYIFDDIFNPPAAFGVRYPESARKVAATAEELKPLCRKVHDDPFGGIWVVDDASPQ